MNEVAWTHLDQIQITQLHAESCCFLDEVTFSVDSGRDA